ncbi:MAG: hypothetical protein ACD_71C00102G0001, partial [uncultured bacterium (gcode 4)]
MVRRNEFQGSHLEFSTEKVSAIRLLVPFLSVLTLGIGGYFPHLKPWMERA